MPAPDASPIAFVLAPVDAARAWCLRQLGRWVAPFVRDRDDRIVTSFAALALVSLALVSWAPGIALFAGPLVLGVPHLLADLRYLVVRRGLLARGTVVAFVLVPTTLVVVLAPLEVTALALAGAACVASGPASRRVLVLVGAALVFVLHRRFGAIADAAFAHGHHLIALIAFAAFAERRRSTLPTLLAIAAVVTVILIASFDPTRFACFGFQAAIGPLGAVLAPTATARTAALLLAVYALHQSLHYGLWLRLVPDAVRERSAPRSFVSSQRALVRELGAPLVAATLVLALAFVVAAFATGVVEARDHYMRLALFHGPLEVALLALAFAEDRRP